MTDACLNKTRGKEYMNDMYELIIFISDFAICGAFSDILSNINAKADKYVSFATLIIVFCLILTTRSSFKLEVVVFLTIVVKGIWDLRPLSVQCWSTESVNVRRRLIG